MEAVLLAVETFVVFDSFCESLCLRNFLMLVIREMLIFRGWTEQRKFLPLKELLPYYSVTW